MKVKYLLFAFDLNSHAFESGETLKSIGESHRIAVWKLLIKWF